jgi:polyribonucleotide nucleotidyltransferase
MVRDVTASAEIGKTYLGKVVRLAEFGAFVELFPGTDGLLHISEISEHRIRDVRDELKLGDQVLVKVLSIEGNKVRLSRKALIREAREKQQKAAAGGGGTQAPVGSEGHSGGDSGGHE